MIERILEDVAKAESVPQCRLAPLLQSDRRPSLGLT
jgi:hypothetical protein